MRTTVRTALLVAAFVALASPARATTIDIAPGNPASGNTYGTNRLIWARDDAFNNVVFLNDYFSSYQGSNYLQKTLLLTPGSAFDAAIQAAVGSSYTINDVKLIVGSAGEPYLPDSARGAYLIQSAYDPTTVTWNNWNGDYNATALATGVLDNTAGTTTWTFAPSLVSGWITGPTSNFGLAFPDYSTTEANSYTAYANVKWQLDVSAGTPVPEIDPAGLGSVLALVTGALGLVERRRLGAA